MIFPKTSQLNEVKLIVIHGKSYYIISVPLEVKANCFLWHIYIFQVTVFINMIVYIMLCCRI